MTEPLELLAPAELAKALNVPIQTIYRWRRHGDGPRGIRVGRHVRYRRSDVEAWLEQRADPQVRPAGPVRHITVRPADPQVKQVGAVG